MIKIERILCPTDLSPESDEALRYAISLARAYDARLFLCYCRESKAATAAASAPAQNYLKEVFEPSIANHLGLADFSQLKWEGIILPTSNGVGEQIVGEAAKRRIDLIVMRSRRRPHAAPLLGSTAEAICRTAPCPVLITHRREREWVGLSTGEIDLRRLLVAYDFSDDAERALSYGLSLAQEYQAELHLLHVLRNRDGAPYFTWAQEGAEANYQKAATRLQNTVPKEAHLWCRIKIGVRQGKPYQEVLAYAREQEIDLISMGANGKNFSVGALFGSNVDRVLRQAPCPVLVARPLKSISIAHFDLDE